MSSSKQLTFQLAAQNILRTIHFLRQWCQVFSLVTAIGTRYQLPDVTLSTKTLSAAMGRLETCLDDLSTTHPSGIY